jgi:glutamate racemase
VDARNKVRYVASAMAIGVFDSGVGGLTIHRALTVALPAADFIYLADQANAPYGNRPGEEIVALTRAGCERLFAAGASLVVLGCNTASAIALRRLQQSWLPAFSKTVARPVNVVGIIVPTIEAATGLPWNREPDWRREAIGPLDILGVFSTPATAKSRVYEIEIDKRRDDIAVFSEPCPDLARLIEGGAKRDALRPIIAGHVANVVRRIGRAPDRAVLACTHYEIVADLFRDALPEGTPLIHQPAATADALVRYLERHREYDQGSGGGRRFLSTRDGARNPLAEAFWGGPLTFEAA